MEELTYSPPVDRLLSLGRPQGDRPDEWANYETLGVGTDDLPQLMRLLTDARLNDERAEEPEAWAPLHAWRALAQMHVAPSAAAMLEALHQREQGYELDEWGTEELPAALTMLGREALPAIERFIADDSREPRARGIAAEVFGKLGKASPQDRPACVAAASAALERCQTNPEPLNTGLVYALLDLKAVEAAPVLRRAYHAKRVDRLMVGDWRDVRRELGLAREPDDPPELPPGKSLWDGTPMGEAARLLRRALFPPGVPPGRSIDRARDKQRARRKQARKARRENRRHRH